MNKRQESKIKTRELIIETTIELIKQRGISELTTAEIAEKCGISHGSIFQHFGNRETLIDHVLQEKIKSIAADIKFIYAEQSKLEEMLDKYIQLLMDEEEFFVALYKELPFMSENTKLGIISVEAIVRNAFFIEIEKSNSRLKQNQITVALDAFFSMITRFLTLKEIYTQSESVISYRTSDIKTLFQLLFEE